MFLSEKFNMVLITTFVFLSYVFSRTLCATMNQNGGYENILVSIPPHINSSELSSILQELKDLFQQSSVLLYSSTRGSFYFEEINFILPKNFKDVRLPDIQPISRKSYAEADIFVLEKGLFNMDMYTIQHQGCGEKGLKINIPVPFLTDANKKHKSKLLVHEWAHYRFGVFDEHGFLNDSLYPVFYSTPGKSDSEYSVNGCTNEQPIYDFTDESGQQCNPPANDCIPIPSKLGNQNILSSLMHKPFFLEVNQFCDEDRFIHVKNMPTKQNALCREQSTWKVVSESNDFLRKKIKTIRSIAAPRFQYIVETEIKLILTIEATNNLKGKMQLVKNAFSYFTLYDLPQQSQISILNMLTSKQTPFFKVDEDTDRIFDAFPEAYGESNICVHCSLITALKALNTGNSKSSGFIILVTTKDISKEELENTKNMFNTEDVKLFVIFFGSFSSAPPLLEQITSLTAGRLFFMQEDFKNHKLLSPLTVLYEAFRTIYETFSWIFRNKILIDEKIFHNYSTHSMLFDVDESIETLHVILTGSDFISEPPVIRDTIVLKYSNAEYTADPPSFSYKIRIPAYLFTIESPEVGQWELSFQRKSNYYKPFVVIVRGMSSDDRKIINARCWISAREDAENKPTIIYSQIYKGIQPVIKSTSTAYIFHHDTEEETVLSLTDNGEGDPDITKNDGIYSKYLTGIFKKGYYTLTVVIKSNETTFANASNEEEHRCCGSVIPEALAVTTRYSRIVTYGSFYIEENILHRNFPPRRITDLHITNVLTLENNVRHYTLQWTAPGAVLDAGTASGYEMKIFRTRNDALNNFNTASLLDINEWKTHGKWLQTEPAGTIQTLIIELRDLETGFYFLAMRALNNEKNFSDISNIVSLYYIKPISPEKLSTTTNPYLIKSTSQTSKDINDEQLQQTDANLGAIVGGSCAVLFLFLVAGIILLIYLSRKRSSKKTKKESISPPYFPRHRPPSAEVMYNSSASIGEEQQIPHNNSISTLPKVDHPKSNEELHNYDYYPTISSRWKLPADDTSLSSFTDSRIYTIGDYIQDQNSFYNVPLRDEVNAPFNPLYTSSLRRVHVNNNVAYRLGTDV